MVERHHQQHGEIDWGAVFDGLSHATATGNTLAPDPGAQDHGVAQGDAADNLNHVDHGTVWDHLFPPPITTPRLAIGAALTSQSAENTPRSVEPGPSRPRGQHRSYPYSASAPLTPNPAYGANGSQDQFFAHLAGSMFLSQQHTGDSDGGREAVGLPTVPAPQGHNPAPPDLERIGSRKPRLDNPPQWHLPSPSSSTFAFTLPPPHPSLAQHALPHNGRQSTPVWPNYNGAGPSNLAYTPSERGPSSADSTPQVPPPGTPIQPVSTESSAGSLDTEDKRQRNTLASAKFRAKRKKHITNISKRIGELEGEHSTLTRDVADLRQENKFLREMVELKYGLDVGPGEGEDGVPEGQDQHDDGQWHRDDRGVE